MRFLLLLLPLYMYCGEYYAKIEPLNKYTISSKVFGLVTFTNDKLISKEAKDETIVKIDDEISKINYELAKATYDIKRDFYKKIKNLKTKSKMQKDNEKIAFLKSKQSFLHAKDDLKSRNIKAQNLYIDKILVKKGNYVNPGTPLLKAFDISEGKIIIFVTKEDIENIDRKKILVNGRENFKLLRYFKTTDDIHVSSYKVILKGKKPKFFSQIAKVEIK